MNTVLEILNCLAALAIIIGFAFDRWRDYKQRRMTREKRESPAATGLPNHCTCAARPCLRLTGFASTVIS